MGIKFVSCGDSVYANLNPFQMASTRIILFPYSFVRNWKQCCSLILPLSEGEAAQLPFISPAPHFDRTQTLVITANSYQIGNFFLLTSRNNLYVGWFAIQISSTRRMIHTDDLLVLR